MAKEYKNGFGVSYRELQNTAEELQQILNQGERRLSHEEIHWRRDAIKEIKRILSAINITLDEFEKFAPPPVRTEPPKEINN